VIVDQAFQCLVSFSVSETVSNSIIRLFIWRIDGLHTLVDWSLVASSPLCDPILIEINCVYALAQIPHRVDIATHLPSICRNEILFPHCWCVVHIVVYKFSPIFLVSTWWWPTQKRTEICSWFLQQFEIQLYYDGHIHFISTRRLARHWRGS
jgi:hypothetical protein